MESLTRRQFAEEVLQRGRGDDGLVDLGRGVALDETEVPLAACLAPGGEVWLYNEAVSVMSSQRECRADLDAALASHGFVVAEGTRSGLALPAHFGDLPTHAYLLRLTRPTSP